MNIIHIKHLLAIKLIIIIILYTYIYTYIHTYIHTYLFTYILLLAQFCLVDANAIPPTKPTTVPP